MSCCSQRIFDLGFVVSCKIIDGPPYQENTKAQKESVLKYRPDPFIHECRK